MEGSTDSPGLGDGVSGHIIRVLAGEDRTDDIRSDMGESDHWSDPRTPIPSMKSLNGEGGTGGPNVGSSIEKVDPSPSPSEKAVILPPCRLMMELDNHSPRPDPPPC
mmetsp:Transcript_14767/g.14869  ORF Transcript_14767/g.14869 Transcript_14767/m.14869 type:complete len:107 (-) Transcript_14767:140-460(-)